MHKADEWHKIYKYNFGFFEKRSIFAALKRNELRIVPWCNGSTPVFGTVSQGSSPCGTTQSPVII